MTSGPKAAQRRVSRPKRLTMAGEIKPTKTTAPFDAVAWLADYAPTGYVGRTAETDAFVLSTLRAFFAVATVEEISTARRFARVLALLAAYVKGTGGTLSVREALDPRTINQFHDAEVARLKAAAKALEPEARAKAKTRAESRMATFRSCLRRIGEALNPTAPWEFAPLRAYRHVKTPYTPEEIAQLEAQIPHMAPARGRCAEALLILGLGAGLDGRWSAKVTTDDVAGLPGGGYGVVVAGRFVPVLAAYEARLEALLAQCAAGEFLIGGRARHADAANEAVTRLRLDARGPKLDLARLRSTWLVHHLTVGTRLPELMEAAGLETLTVLGDLTEFIAPMHPDRETSVASACQAVRGAERNGAVL